MQNRFSFCGIHIGTFFFILILIPILLKSIKKMNILLLGMKYDKDISNNNVMDRTKNTSLTIGGNNMKIEIKMNGNICLEEQNNKLIINLF